MRSADLDQALLNGRLPEAGLELALPTGAPQVGIRPFASAQAGQSHWVALVNPFGRALQTGVDLNALLHRDPESGDQTRERLAEAARTEIAEAVRSGASGIVYLLAGANARHCTPMQYGGYYLELDRTILEAIPEGVVRALVVLGGADTYIDFVSDLPVHLFGWSASESGFAAATVRRLRAGLLWANDPEADILLNQAGSAEELEEVLLREVLTERV